MGGRSGFGKLGCRSRSVRGGWHICWLRPTTSRWLSYFGITLKVNSWCFQVSPSLTSTADQKPSSATRLPSGNFKSHTPVAIARHLIGSQNQHRSGVRLDPVFNDVDIVE